MKLNTLKMGALALMGLTSFAFGEVELDGYCPVCYVAAGKAVQGSKEFKVEHDGETYYFVNADAKSAFEKSPEKFIPAYDGWCAFGISKGKKLEADPTQFSVVDGTIYLSSSAEVKKMFDADAKKVIMEADKKWMMDKKM